jgi:hypothetical protein
MELGQDSPFHDALDGVHAFCEDFHAGAVGYADEVCTGVVLAAMLRLWHVCQA